MNMRNCSPICRPVQRPEKDGTKWPGCADHIGGDGMTELRDQVAAGTRVLVTGAGGFIGSHLVDSLLSAGHSVTGLDRCPAGDRRVAANLAEALHQPNFTFVHADLCADDLGPLLAECSTVFHLAAIPGVRPSWTRFEDYALANIVGTQRLLDECMRSGVRRVVYASSSSVYGRTTGVSRESDPALPVSPYGVSKLAGELLCLAYAELPERPLTAVALRYFTVYGPRQRPDMAIGRLLTAAHAGSPFQLYGDGTQQRDFTFISDVVDATVAAGRAELPSTVRSAVVNVGGGASVSMAQLVSLVEQIVGRPAPIARMPITPGDMPITAADLTAAHRLLGYRPAVRLADGVRRHAEWLLPPVASVAH
jgi:nucleoside-diphosphate-sugar epimerase